MAFLETVFERDLDDHEAEQAAAELSALPDGTHRGVVLATVPGDLLDDRDIPGYTRPWMPGDPI